MNILHLLFTVAYLSEKVWSTTIIQTKVPNELNTSNLIINFSPKMSILDRYNDARYGVDDLVPIVSLVATRFKRVCITVDLSEIKRGYVTSSMLSAFAVAKYNCLSTTHTKVEIILRIGSWGHATRLRNRWCNCSNLETEKRSYYPALKWYLEKINNECSETVKLIISTARFCDNSTFVKCQPSENRPSLFTKYEWTVELDYNFVDGGGGHYGNIFKYEHFSSDVAVIVYDRFEMFLDANNQNKLSVIKANLQVKSLVHSVKFSNQYNNMSGFISTWKTIFDIEDEIFIVNSAFDEHLDRFSPTEFFSGGWWYLVDDLGNVNMNLDKFVEKITVAEEIDARENPKNFEWLKKNLVFNYEYTGLVIVSDLQVPIAQNNFCRFLIGQVREPLSIQQKTLDLIGNSSSCTYPMEIMSYYSNQLSRFGNNTVNRIIMDLGLITPEGRWLYYQNQLDKFKEDLKAKKILKYGYSLNLDFCGYSEQMQSNKKFMKIIRDPQSSMYLFYYDEPEENIENGATQMFQRVKVLFQECQKMVFGNRNNKSTDIAFSLQGYFMDSSFYNSPKNLQNYVKYISLLNEWIGQQNNTFLFLGQLVDSKIKFEYDDVVKPTVGWFSQILSTNLSTWNDKRQDALHVSMQKYSRQKSKIVNKISNLNRTQIITIVLSSLLACCVLVTSAIYFTRRYYSNRKLTAEEVEKFLNGENCEGQLNKADELPYDKEKYEIPSESFVIEDELGSGEFGKVFRGKILLAENEISVAIKTSNPKTSHKTALKGLLSEIKLLAYIGKHPNIVELLGANSKDLKDGKIYLFLELCELGTLQNKLKEMGQKIQSRFVELEITDNSMEMGTIKRLDSISSANLGKWSSEICKGMVYLAEKHVVHADLATRNVLLNLRKEAKICDFGLSRRMYNYTNYKKSQKEYLPWKWMAPEALNFMVFSEKSDVWSFGVTLWEIYSLGKCPYPGLSFDVDFAGMLERGLRMPEPEFNEKDVYAVMRKCWETDDKERPTFLQIQELLSDLTIGTLDIAETGCSADEAHFEATENWLPCSNFTGCYEELLSLNYETDENVNQMDSMV